MSKVQIRYDILIQDAFRSVVRSILTDVSKEGLRGDHHYYIKVDCTQHGVNISADLREMYENEITIVLQHQFWDLIVSNDTFEVTLVFNGVSEQVVVPFTAIKGFYDPSVNFSIEFDLRMNDGKAPKSQVNSHNVTQIGNNKPNVSNQPPKGESTPKVGKSKGKAKKSGKSGEKKEDLPESNVVSLDAFRKKT